MKNKQSRPSTPTPTPPQSQNNPLAKNRAIFFILAALLFLILSSFLNPSTAQENEFPGARIVHLLQEPRHRTVHQEGDLYLLDVQINPGDTSLPHIHNQPIMRTYISMADGPGDGRLRSITDYAHEALTHKVSNAGPGLLRIIALVNDSAGNINLEDDRPDGLNAEPELENAWFRSYRIELAPGEKTKIQRHRLPSVVVQVVDGLLQVIRDDGLIDELDRSGDWAWRKAGQSYTVRNVGTTTSAVVITEGGF